MIYVINAPDIGPGRVKIGYTSKPAWKRLNELQTGSPVPLWLALEIPGDLRLERDLHALYGHLSVHGEWFEFGSRNAVAEVGRAVEAERTFPGIIRRTANEATARRHAERVKAAQHRRMELWRAGQ